MNLKMDTSRNKLFIGFLLIGLLCLMVILVDQSSKNRQLQMKSELLMEQNILIEIQKMIRLGLTSDNEGAYYFMSATDEQKKRHLEGYKENVEALNEELENLRPMLTRQQDTATLINFQMAWRKSLQENEEAFQLEAEGDTEQAKALFTNVSFVDVKDHLTSLRDQQMRIITEKEREMERYQFFTQKVDTGITAGFILFTIAFGWILSRKVQLEHHLNAQKQFYQNTSHDLKTPLMSIQGYAQAILDGTLEGTKVPHSLKIIISESERLKRLVTEMILLSKLENETGSFDFQTVPINFLVEESVFRMNPLLKEKGVTVDLNQIPSGNSWSPMVRVDAEKSLQALLNILSNALRYAIHSIHISIAEKGRQVLIEIRDDGEGIPEEIIPKLFERFVTGKNGENGLGLAIARAIIEQSGGTIQAFNHKDGGAVFRISLPVFPEC